jgi:hypothetical protein
MADTHPPIDAPSRQTIALHFNPKNPHTPSNDQLNKVFSEKTRTYPMPARRAAWEEFYKMGQPQQVPSNSAKKNRVLLGRKLLSTEHI